MSYTIVKEPGLIRVTQYHSPYYNESHAALRDEVRQWVEEKCEPFISDWEKNKFVPPEIYKEMGTLGFLPGYVNTMGDQNIFR